MMFHQISHLLAWLLTIINGNDDNNNNNNAPDPVDAAAAGVASMTRIHHEHHSDEDPSVYIAKLCFNSFLAVAYLALSIAVICRLLSPLISACRRAVARHDIDGDPESENYPLTSPMTTTTTTTGGGLLDQKEPPQSSVIAVNGNLSEDRKPMRVRSASIGKSHNLARNDFVFFSPLNMHRSSDDSDDDRDLPTLEMKSGRQRQSSSASARSKASFISATISAASTSSPWFLSRLRMSLFAIEQYEDIFAVTKSVFYLLLLSAVLGRTFHYIVGAADSSKAPSAIAIAAFAAFRWANVFIWSALFVLIIHWGETFYTAHAQSIQSVRAMLRAPKIVLTLISLLIHAIQIMFIVLVNTMASSKDEFHILEIFLSVYHLVLAAVITLFFVVWVCVTRRKAWTDFKPEPSQIDKARRLLWCAFYLWLGVILRNLIVMLTLVFFRLNLFSDVPIFSSIQEHELKGYLIVNSLAFCFNILFEAAPMALAAHLMRFRLQPSSSISTPTDYYYCNNNNNNNNNSFTLPVSSEGADGVDAPSIFISSYQQSPATGKAVSLRSPRFALVYEPTTETTAATTAPITTTTTIMRKGSIETTMSTATTYTTHDSSDVSSF